MSDRNPKTDVIVTIIGGVVIAKGATGVLIIIIEGTATNHTGA